MNLKALYCILCCIYFVFLVSTQVIESDEGGYTFINKVRFPFSRFYDPFMGLIIAFDIKLEPSEIDADFAWNIEANYFLPQNESEYTFPPVVPAESSDRGLFDRSMLYRMIEMKLESFSRNSGGKNCFLRMICEMALYTTKDTDILGDIMHIIFSPSSSINKNLPPKYINAELFGLKNNHCKKYSKKCPLDIFSIFSVIGEILDNKFFE